MIWFEFLNLLNAKLNNAGEYQMWPSTIVLNFDFEICINKRDIMQFLYIVMKIDKEFF